MTPHVQTGVVTLELRIPAAWGNARAELATAFYTAAFDLGTDALKRAVGLDEAHRERAGRSTVALESHIVFLGFVAVGAEVRVATRVVDCDAKRMHLAQRMHCADALLATRECLTLSFDLAARRSCAFDATVRARIEALYDAQRILPAHLGTAHLLGVGHGP